MGSDSLLVDGFGSCFMGGVVMSWCMGCLMRSLVMWVCDLMALFVVRLSVLLIQRFEVQISMLVVSVEWLVVKLVVF